MEPLRTLWRYYPENKGLFSGCVLTGFGLSTLIFNKISDNIINPYNEEIDKNTKFYPENGEKSSRLFVCSMHRC